MKTKLEQLHQILCDKYENAKLKNILAHKNNDLRRKDRTRGQMDAFESAIVTLQNIRSL